MVELFTSPEHWLSFLMLSAMEIVLGIDNIIFISILAGRLPEHEREKARKLGLMGALVSRLILLFFISWIAQLTAPLFSVMGRDFSGKSLILLIGGLFLMYKATKEIHHKMEEPGDEATMAAKAGTTLASVITQIMLLDIVFSLDSVITAVGMSSKVAIMVAANVVALGVMLAVGGKISTFIDRHPTIKVLALSFLMMIGLVLIADGVSFHIPKGYVYFAMAFSMLVEVLNIRVRKVAKPVISPKK